MKLIKAYYTDIGIKKHINEDSLLIKSASTSKGKIVLAMICDGMGGLSNGELASATVIEAFSNWFENELKNLMKDQQFNVYSMQKSINNVLIQKSQDIMNYGYQNKVRLGTTATGIILFDNQYIIFHVGDTRIYCISDKIEQLTEDQTWINNEIKQGNMDISQIKTDPRRNVLLQCIGASKVVHPDFYYGTIKDNDIFLLCSDGFRHEISDDEIFSYVNLHYFQSEDIMNDYLKELVELNKSRKVLDNITVIAIRLEEDKDVD